MSYRVVGLLALAAGNLFCQNANYPYIFNTFAGSYPLGDGGPATQALLLTPTAAIPDAAGNLYVADGSNYRIRKFAAGGAISTLAQCPFPSGMALGKDGNLYVTSPGLVFKVGIPSGTITVLAGNDTPGFSGDGGLATQALIGSASGIALDSSGNIIFVDGSRIREITAADGKINTIAGTGIAGAPTDNVSPLSTNLYYPSGLAIDSSNNIYVADTDNYRVRKISNGLITTILGTGGIAQAVPGPAKSSTIGQPNGLTIDASGNLYVSDIYYQQILKIDTSGNLTQVAGQQATFGYSDGPAATTYLDEPYGLAPDGSGGLYIADFLSSRIRHLSGGSVTTIAGMLHYGGDNGQATSALLYNPSGQVMDAQGNAYILDASNYRIRKVAPSGVITTFAGNGLLGTPAEGAAAASTPLPLIYSMAIDGQGNLYLGVNKIYKITTAGAIGTFAGTTGVAGGTGDGGPANKAGFGFVTALAVDGSGNVYVADAQIPRIRKITTDGNINNFAGTGTAGSTGDGGLATAATIYSGGPLAVDAKGNLYIGAAASNAVRMVTSGGLISTVAGNGTAGSPTDGAAAKTSPFTAASGLTTDSAGNVYIMSGDARVYRLDTAGLIHIVAGSGKSTTLTNGVLATSIVGIVGKGISVSASGDLLVADPGNSAIRQLTLDSPSGVVAAGGNSQSAPVGTALAVPITVTVSGRGGVNVPGATVNFAVTSGSATLSASSSQTDSTGTAGVGVTLGATAGPVAISATIAGSTLAAAQFTETATSVIPGCTVGAPVITSVRSLTDFGGLSTFGSGSWLEVKGSNLAIDSRLWAGSDFNGSNAPTKLDGSSVSINGNAGFVEYISAGQINVQAPADTATGAVPITVTNCAGTSAATSAQRAAIAPGVLATSAFDIGGKQYLVALYQDGVTYVGNAGLIAGVPFRPAKVGDMITVYGIGFGAVTPAVAPGVVVAQQNAISGLTVSFGQTAAATTYAGLSPGNIGLYQFDITVPNVAPGDYQISMSVGGTALQQTVYLTVGQ